MNQPLSYPLEQLMIIKKNRFDQAAKALEIKKEILKKTKEKLDELALERDKVKEHRTAKMEQFRQSLDAGTTTDKIQQMKGYLKTVEEKLADRQKKVAEGQKQVELAQKQVELATQELFQRKKDLEKLEIHKKEWEKELLYWTTQKEAMEQDEQGSQTHTSHKREAKMRKKRDHL